MSEKLDLIYDIVKDIDRKQDAQSERLAKLETLTDKNTDDLEKHIEGVVQTRRLIALTEEKLLKKDEEAHTKLNKRLTRLEQPYTVATILTKWAVALGTVGGAVYGIYRGYLALHEWGIL